MQQRPMWREEYLWNVSVLHGVHLSDLVTLHDDNVVNVHTCRAGGSRVMASYCRQAVTFS
jgi:hypothetical protein